MPSTGSGRLAVLFRTVYLFSGSMCWGDRLRPGSGQGADELSARKPRRGGLSPWFGTLMSSGKMANLTMIGSLHLSAGLKKNLAIAGCAMATIVVRNFFSE